MTISPLRLGGWLRGLGVWQQRAAAFAAGAVSALAFAPLNAFPAMLLGYAVLLVLLDGAPARPSSLRHFAWLGWAFGCGQFLVGLHWIVFPFFVDPVQHGWQAPFALLAMSAGLALFPCLACLAAAYFWHTGVGRLFIFTAAFSASQWLRGHVFTGFPWNLSAYGWGASLEILQSTALFGAYGLTLLTILLGASLAELMSQRIRWQIPAAMTVLFAALWFGGASRLASTTVQFEPNVQLRIVQPNVPENEKNSRQYMLRNWQRLLTLSRSVNGPVPTHIIWPEAAVPFLLTDSPEAMDQVGTLTGPSHVLITGAIRREQSGDGEPRYFNSLYVLGAGSNNVYDKFHLVPFGEYLPFEGVLNALGITKLAGGAVSLSAGNGPRTLSIPNAPPAGPLICYEIIFPGAVTASPRPQWFINLTNDAWFGPWAGPRQHLLSARVRAIEEGIPVVRAANTGISGVIDGTGQILASLPLNQMGVLNSALPKALPPTPYAKYGDLGFLLLLLSSAAMGAGLRSRK